MTDTLKDYKVSYQHKDRLFRFIFKEKEALLSLYNAINESDYQDVQALKIYTMEDYVYMGMKNDLSFLIDWNLNVFEHQSTYNPNMPLRGLIYMAAAYRKYIDLNRLDIYASKPLPLPVPRYYVFYNGTKAMADEALLRLTDNMDGEDAAEKSCAQFIAQMVNINAGYNSAIMKRCPLLYEYSVYIANIRSNQEKGLVLEEAINQAVAICIREGILSDILRANKAEVTSMLLTEYDEVFHISSEKDISFKEGQESERKNTEREKQRADAALKQVEAEKQRSDAALKQVEAEKQRSDAALKQVEAEKQRSDAALKQVDMLQLQVAVLSYRLQGKNDDEIAKLTGLSVNEVRAIPALVKEN